MFLAIGWTWLLFGLVTCLFSWREKADGWLVVRDLAHSPG